MRIRGLTYLTHPMKANSNTPMENHQRSPTGEKMSLAAGHGRSGRVRTASTMTRVRT